MPMVAIFSLFVVTGIRGVNFGYHWDEGEAQIRPVQEMVSTGFLFPRASGYPGFSKWLTLLPALPVGVKTAIQKKGDPRLVQAAMLATVNGPGFLLTVRQVYVVFSALAIIWVWAAALALRRPWWEASVAAACIGLSWEYAYHARWVATDCPLVQFSALTLFMLALYFYGRRPLWLYAAAFAAAFATGTKYQGLVLVLPVLLAGVLTLPARPVRGWAIRIVALSAVAFAAFLIASPQTVSEPFANWEELLRISQYYATGHFGHTVFSTSQHLRLVLIYLSVSFFSPYKPVALALFASAVVGAVFWVRSDRRVGAVLLCFPIAFLLLFCAKYRVMIVRNYLLVAPFLAVFAARGLSELGRLLPGRWLRWSLAGAVAVVFVAGGVWLVSAAESIRHADQKEEVRSALAYVGKHPSVRFKLSPQVTSLAKQQHLPLPPNARAQTDIEQVVFFPRAEAVDIYHWKTNDPWLTKAVLGPRDVNFNWYSGWQGPDRVVIMTKAKALEGAAGIAFVK
jgi:4-amino-4-deoxy-L-arabinose transferase-like glycosyltransferase